MAETNQDEPSWETEEQVSACLAVHNVSRDQITRWRREGLLPDVEQIPNAYHGSTVLYPPGTCEQVAAAARLFREKNRADYVGRMLWWQGFSVDEKYWKPDLVKLAGWLDKGCRVIKRLMDRGDNSRRTLPERLTDADYSDIVLSRIRPRLDRNQLASFLRVACDTASGLFERFEEPERDARGNERAFDKAAIVEGLDIEASATHSILGQRLRLKDGIEDILKSLARATQMNSPLAIATGPEEILFSARDDVRNALRIGLALYETFEWIYGRRAFGLRIAAWIAKKRPTKMLSTMILLFALLRRSSNDLLSSEEISRLAGQAARVRDQSHKYRQLWKYDPRFRNVLNPKRVREGLRDQVSLKAWHREIAMAAQMPRSKESTLALNSKSDVFKER